MPRVAESQTNPELESKRTEPHRSYWPVVVICGIVPSVMLLICGGLFGCLLFNASYMYALGGGAQWVVLGAMFLVPLAILNFFAFRPSGRYQRLLAWLAAVPNAGFVLLAVQWWKDSMQFSHGREPFEAIGVGLVGLSILFALAWSRIARTERLRVTLGQFARFTLALCLLLAAANWILQPQKLANYRREQPAIDRIEAIGGSVYRRNWEATGVTFRASRVTDNDLQLLAGLPKLVSINLSGTQITDAGLHHLAPFTGLEHLYLYDTSVSDAGLAKLAPLTELDNLWLGGTNVSDEGLVHLAGMHKLGYLDLHGAAVSDRGLERLTHLKELYYLGLPGTQVTKEGVDKLHAALPNCHIYATPDGEDYSVGP